METISVFTAMLIGLYGVVCFVFGMVVYKWLLKKEN